MSRSSCSTRASSSRLPVGGALRLALQVLLLDLEAGEDGALGRLLLAQRLQLRRRPRPRPCSALASASVARPTFSSAAARSASSASTWPCASAQLQVQHDGLELADLGRRSPCSAAPARACRFRLSICELSWPRMSLRRARLPSAARRRSSASWRRLCRPAMPAASSRMRRRCSGLALTSSPIWPWRTSAGERAPVAASSNRMRTSRARTSRPLMR